MNNYKELVSALREEAEAVKAVEWDIPICTSNHIAEAADVIEQQKSAIERLEAENRAKEQYIAETIGKVIKERDELKEVNILLKANCDHFKRERDAAIADLKVNWLCAVCKKRVVTKEWMACKNKDFYEAPCEAPTCLNFEWRGVQEVEHENA